MFETTEILPVVLDGHRSASYRIVSMRFEKSQVTEMTVLKSPHQTIDNILPSRDWKRPQFTDFTRTHRFRSRHYLETN